MPSTGVEPEQERPLEDGYCTLKEVHKFLGRLHGRANALSLDSLSSPPIKRTY